MESFKHKNIIKLINSYIYEHNFYTVMEYAKGGELNSNLQNKNVYSENECKKLFKQMHEAVKYIHARNVIHRDLKPNNILYMDKNYEHIVIIDFGISGYNSGNIKESVKAGTPKFLAPELAAGLNYNSSPKLDVWALGIILYLMLFGSFPFDGNKDSEVLNKIVKENLKFPSNIKISKAGCKLLNALLEKDQGLRVDLTSELFDEWYHDER